MLLREQTPTEGTQVRMTETTLELPLDDPNNQYRGVVSDIYFESHRKCQKVHVDVAP